MAPPSRGAVRLWWSVGQLRAFTKGARVLLGSLSRALMRLLSRAEMGRYMFRLTTLQVGSGARCARHPSLEASLRARGSIEGEGLPERAAPGLPPPCMLPRCPRRRNKLTEARTAARELSSFARSRLCARVVRVRVLHGLIRL